MTLTGKQRRALRALGHHLDPVIQIGKEGVSAALVEAALRALFDHELVKVKVLEASPLDRHEVAEALAEACGAEVAQVLGRTLLLYKRNEEAPKLALPDLPLPPKPKDDSRRKPARRPSRRAGSRRDE